MKLSDVREHQVINCKTLEENIRICTMLDEQGFKMLNGGSYKSDSRWRRYTDLTCYDIYTGEFGTTRFYLNKAYTVINSTVITDETASETPDPVNQPQHYGGQDDTYEAIKVINAWGLGFELGNALKYIARAGKKDPAKRMEDLKKAAWYLAHELSKH